MFFLVQCPAIREDQPTCKDACISDQLSPYVSSSTRHINYTFPIRLSKCSEVDVKPLPGGKQSVQKAYFTAAICISSPESTKASQILDPTRESPFPRTSLSPTMAPLAKICRAQEQGMNLLRTVRKTSASPPPRHFCQQGQSPQNNP